MNQARAKDGAFRPGSAIAVGAGAVAALATVAYLALPPEPGPVGRPPRAPAGEATRFADVPRIDVHVHVAPAMASEAARIFGEHHVAIALNASGGFPGPALGASAEAERATGGRLRYYCNVAFEHVGAADWPELARWMIDQCRAQGAVGVKIGKGLGLGIPAPEGGLLRVDDPRLDVLFDAAGAAGLPILIHTGDPQAFFEPPTPDNERYAELRAHPRWSFHGTRSDGMPWPSWRALFDQFVQRVERSAGTTFVGAHFGNAPEEPETISGLLDRLPNLVVETGARIPEIGRHEVEAMRRFYVRHADRVLFGTDTQLMPDALVLGSSGAEPDPPSRIPAFFAAHWRYFETNDRGFAHPTPIQGDWTIDGVGLSREILEKIYWRNAARIFRIEVPAGP